MEKLRVKRIEKLIKEIICAMILTDEMKDPRINKLVSIYDVCISKDFKFARVYTSYFGDDAIHENCVAALNHAAGFIQRRLGKQLSIKNIPRLTFIVDKSIENGFRITQKLKELVVEEHNTQEL